MEVVASIANADNNMLSLITDTLLDNIIVLNLYQFVRWSRCWFMAQIYG